MSREPIGRRIPPLQRRDYMVGGSVAFVLAVLAVWVAAGSAPSVVERSAHLVYWAVAGLISAHICIVLYFWRTAGATSDNPYTKAGSAGSDARRWHLFGRACALIFLGAVLFQGQILMAILLIGLSGVNWILQFQIRRSAHGGRAE